MKGCIQTEVSTSTIRHPISLCLCYPSASELLSRPSRYPAIFEGFDMLRAGSTLPDPDAQSLCTWMHRKLSWLLEVSPHRYAASSSYIKNNPIKTSELSEV